MDSFPRYFYFIVTYTHRHTHIDTDNHLLIYMHTYTPYAHMGTYTHTHSICVYVFILMHTHMHPRTHIHTCTQTYNNISHSIWYFLLSVERVKTERSTERICKILLWNIQSLPKRETHPVLPQVCYTGTIENFIRQDNGKGTHLHES